MNMSSGNYSPQVLRNQVIIELDESKDKIKKSEEIADKLFTLGLTMYSRNYCLNSLFYNSFAQSYLDENISLHPEQMNVIEKIENYSGLIFSAPTSFGKTFIIFEYLARVRPHNVVLVVPTLALVDEYIKKIIKRYEKTFKEYNIFLSIDAEKVYNFDKYNIFILTHDRAIEKSSYLTIKKIDLLVIDEVYKLQRDEKNDRVLVLNLAYYYLVKIAEKHVLLAPFIGGIENIEFLEKNPIFYKTNFSPVVNEVLTYEILHESDRKNKVKEIINYMKNDEKTLVYFPTVTKIYEFVKDIEYSFTSSDIEYEEVDEFLDWIKDEIHEEWYLVKAMEKGYLVHNGQLPIGIRLFQLDLYEKSERYNKLLCTSTLLEGVNTTAKNIIITKPARGSTGGNLEIFDAFDFYNLVGRSGRLFKHFLGKAFYIKGPLDPNFLREDAVKKIQFEITDNSPDIDIHSDNLESHPRYNNFLKHLGITHEEYKSNVGFRFRFNTVETLHENYENLKPRLFFELQELLDNNKRGRLYLIRALYEIFEGRGNKLYTYIINKLLYKTRPKLKKIIDETFIYYSKVGLDNIISNTIRMKSSYIEYDFYAKLILVQYYMKCDDVEEKYIEILNVKVKNVIDYLYFTDSNHKRMLKDLGIYEKDIPHIITVIGSDFQDAFELKKRLIKNSLRFYGISIISKYVINELSR
ncbi:MAG: superfamily helicase [Bacilli bacterium]|nr:superfamily helicase [Bacilli bacterium]